jgi:uncharacterized membrane protein
MTLNDCCESFQKQIKALAAKNGKTPEKVYEWWRVYTEDCRNYDQSPVMFEFQQWYADKLAS